MFSRGRRAAPGAGRGLAGRRWVSLVGGGGFASVPYPRGLVRGGPQGRGGGSLCRGLFPRLLQAGTKAGRFVCAPPSMLHSRFCRPAAAHGAPLSASAGLPVGCGHCMSEWAADWGHSVRSCACRGCGVPLCVPWHPRGGCGAAASLAGLRPSAGRGGGGGREGGREGGFPVVPPWSPSAAPGGRGGAAWWFRSGWASCQRGGRTLPLPPSILWVPTLVQALTRAFCSARCRRVVPASQGRGGEGRRVLGAAVWVSGYRLGGCVAVGLAPRSLAPPSPRLEAVRAPPPCRTSGGVGVALRVGGPCPAGRGVPQHCPLPTPSHNGAVTQVVCPLGPPVYAGSSTATQAPSRGRLQGRAALSAPWSPSSCRPSAPWADGPVHDNTTSA